MYIHIERERCVYIYIYVYVCIYHSIAGLCVSYKTAHDLGLSGHSILLLNIQDRS